MNVAVISMYLPSTSKIGAGYQAHHLANALVDRGHDVTIFSPSPRPSNARYRVTQVRMTGSLRTFRFAWKLRSVDFSSFDVLHAHGDDYWVFGHGTPPHVRTMHGSCLAEALHIRGAKARLRMLLLGTSEVAATVVADRTVAVSRNTRKWIPWIRTVIPNGVDLDAFHPGGQKSDRPTVLFVGTYRHRKRGRVLMEVFDRYVLPRVPDAQLWMVCEDAPAQRNVTVLGRVDEAELAALYRRAWVFCLPSTYEGFGIPYVEAMASGTPVVASPNVGAREVLGDGRWGVVAEDHELGRSIVQMLEDGSERNRWAQRGLERSADFSLTRVAACYETLYEELAAGARR